MSVRANYWSGAKSWKKHTNYAYALIVEGNYRDGSSRYYHNYPSPTPGHGERCVSNEPKFTNIPIDDIRMARRKSDVEADGSATQYLTRGTAGYITHVVPIDLYNRLIDRVKTNNAPTENLSDLLEAEQGIITMANDLKGKNPYLVWNRTNAVLAGAFESEEKAIAHATELATKTPTEALVIMVPGSEVYQPANVVIKKLGA